MKNRRKKFLISLYQRQLFCRLLGYGLLWQLAAFAVMFFWMLLHQGAEPLAALQQLLYLHIPIAVCLLLAGPVLAWEVVRFSHRLVGPLVRFRKVMQAVADGEQVGPMRLREGDFLIDMENDFNDMLEEIQRRGVAVLQHGELLSEAEKTEPRKESGELRRSGVRPRAPQAAC